jgi:hypothetical protein
MTTILGEALVSETIAKLAPMEGEKCLRRIERLQRELARYEAQFGLHSAEAWQKYQAGTLGDELDVMEWMTLFENFTALREYYHRSPHWKCFQA